MTMALVVFGKRRRDGEQTASDEELAAAAAEGVGFVPGGTPVPLPDKAGAAAAVSAVQAVATAVPPASVDAHLPRWRRPSLVEARKATRPGASRPATSS